MPQFKIQEAESQIVKKVTFNKATDYVAIQLNSKQTPSLVHAVLADKLIAKKLAVKAKDVEVEQAEPERTVTKLKK